ncbi:S-adenosyl-L-methionine-dependent methyltransferase [Coniella lustricola]|uniref:S-adenosyl-L-methionine-dependent methyltransferase n=1 Tax=Coniella lustricola TaxID=2025994 RepID=A0A2T3AHT6_9PEZI|nr:S-adenosyl-L-methionine-dependent methyltransferase [Coniella lustricola]
MAPSFADVKQAVALLVDPWIFMSLSLSCLPRTIFSLLLAGQFSTLFSPSRLQEVWFGRFWSFAGPNARFHVEKRVVPLLEGRVSAGRILPESATNDDTASSGNERVSGVVMEIGPGIGIWASVFAHPALSPTILQVYGVEPNASHHAELRQRVVKAGLGDRYEIVPVGIENLESSGRVQRESVDCIVSILCLCGVPEPERNIRELYSYLKPGGRWYVFEHVKHGSQGVRDTGRLMRYYQAFVNIFWPTAIGGCELCRNTGKSLMEAGPWSKIDLVQMDGEPTCKVLPHVYGTLTK